MGRVQGRRRPGPPARFVPNVTTVAAYVPDLMDRSKVAAARVGVSFARRPADLVDLAAELYVVDLTRPGVLDVVPRLGGRVIGFANHTQREVMEAALAAGCSQVLARSAFFSRLEELLEAGP